MSTKATRSQRVMSPSLSPVRPQPTARLALAVMPPPLLQPTLCSAFIMSGPDVPLSRADDTFADLADGKLDGQKAFMTGKLKTKGNMMLATKLGPVLTIAKPKAKL